VDGDGRDGPVWVVAAGAGTVDLEVRVHVQPGGARSELVGRHGDRLKVRVAAPPEAGRATAAVLDLLAAVAGVPRRSVTLVAGATSRHKTVRLVAVPAAGAAALHAAGAPRPPGG